MKFLGTASILEVNREFLMDYYIVEHNNSFEIKINKKEQRNGESKLCEEYISNFCISDMEKAQDVLNLLIRNAVTPATADYVLQDILNNN